MHEPLSLVTRLKLLVPVGFLIGSFALFVLSAFLVDIDIVGLLSALGTFATAILWLVARVQLGDAPRQNRLVTSGLYSELRHPIYYFSTLAFLGVAVFMRISILFIPVVCIAIAQIVRIRYEERELIARLGNRYARYKRRTRF